MVGNGVRHSLVVMQICESRVLELAGGGGLLKLVRGGNTLCVVTMSTGVSSWMLPCLDGCDSRQYSSQMFLSNSGRPLSIGSLIPTEATRPVPRLEGQLER